MRRASGAMLSNPHGLTAVGRRGGGPTQTKLIDLHPLV